MKKFFGEFKAFISRGNVIDLAVGVIIGGAFSAIVTALTNYILMPVINLIITAILGKEGLSGAVWVLSGSADDLPNAIYIDWGAFISAIINFLLIALVLFLIVKAINSVNAGVKKGMARFEPLTKAEVKALRKQGKTSAEIEALAHEKALAEEEAAKLAAAEAAANAPKTEQQLLSEIVDLLKEKQ